MTQDKLDEPTLQAIVAWMRGIPLEWREDWGLNATEEIAGLLESGLWLFDGTAPEPCAEPKGDT